MKELMEVYKESLRKLQERHAKLVQEIHVYDKRVALFAHQGFGLAFLSRVLGIPYPMFSTQFDMGHSGMTVIEFKDENGKTLGRHGGIIRYTVGQRKGLGIALGEPMYVVEKNLENNTVTLARNSELFGTTLTASNINLISCEKITDPIKVKAKIRYNQKEQPATVEQIDKDTIKVTFDEPQRAITRGQSVVLYDGDIVVGGGIIN